MQRLLPEGKYHCIIIFGYQELAGGFKPSSMGPIGLQNKGESNHHQQAVAISSLMGKTRMSRPCWT